MTDWYTEPPDLESVIRGLVFLGIVLLIVNIFVGIAILAYQHKAPFDQNETFILLP